jgi:hypothetical protein
VTTPTSEPDFLLVLRTLAEHKVDFIVIGGVAAALQGAPIHTQDLDLVHSRAPENLDRLLAALLVLDAFYRGQGSRRLAPQIAYLATPGHQLLMTRGGALDLLGTVGAVGHERGYEALLPHTIEMTVEALPLRVLDLETVIELKEEAARDKDRAVLPTLRRTLEEKKQQEGRDGSPPAEPGPCP